MSWHDRMTETEMEMLQAQVDELDAAYADYQIEREASRRESEELETEADLYRYWRP
jgi:hypothetical protein